MHSVLFTVNVPAEETDWNTFLTNLDIKARNCEGVTRIALNVWLLDLKKSTTMLGYLTAFAERAGFSYGMLPFADAPQWLPDSFRPMPIDESNHSHRRRS